MVIDVKWINDAQRQYLHSDDKVFCYIGGLGAGKTFIGAADLLLFKLQWPQADCLIAANTYQQLNTATLPVLLVLLDEWEIPYVYHKDQADKHIRINLDGHTGKIHLRSLENYDVALRGIEVSYIWMDETRDTSVDAFRTALARIRQRVAAKDMIVREGTKEWRFSKGQVIPKSAPHEIPDTDVVYTRIRITTTPDMMKAKWLYDYLHNVEMKQELSKKGISIGSAHASMRDNPFLTEDYIATVEQSLDDVMRKQEVDGQWVIIPPGKAVYGSAFNQRLHTGEFNLRPDSTLYIGWDFGFHHPAAVFYQEDDQERLICLGELIGHDITLDDFCDSVWSYLAKHFDVNQKLSNVKIESFCDPAGGQVNDKSEKTSIQVLRSKGFSVVRWKKLKLALGVQLIRRQLNRLIGGKPALVFDSRRCPVSIEGFMGGYHYPKKREEFSEDKEDPYKDGWYEHPMDAHRYLITNLRQVLMGDKKPATSKPKWSAFDSTTGY